MTGTVRASLVFNLVLLVGATLLAGRAGHAPAAVTAGPAAAIDRLLASVYVPAEPGAAALVVKNGRVLLRRGYGLANVELSVAMQPDAVMPIASLSKSLTAAAVLALAEQGKLSLQDDIGRFLPGYPTHGYRVTIEHLLTHTSGISALSDTSDFRATAAQEVRVTDMLTDWTRDLPADAPPGKRWAYSNWGYQLLAAIVERASGASYPDFVQRAFLDPLGMRRTFYFDRRRIVPGRAAGYEALADGLFNVQTPRGRLLQPNGAAGWMSTVDDLARWSEALDGSRVLSRASIDAMFTPYRLEDGTPVGYGYGWDLGDYEGHRIQEHQGGTSGFAAHLVRIPGERVLVVILSNRSSAPVPLQATAHRVAAAALGQPMADPVPVTLPRSVLEGLVGSYRGSDVGTCAIALEGDALTALVPGLGKLPLVPVGATTFRSALVTWTFSFETGADGRAVRMHVRDWKLNDVADRFSPPVVTRRPAITAAGAGLDACAGEYEALNGVLVKVERSADHLAIRSFGQASAEVFPVEPLVFASSDGAVEYRFVKDHTGAVARYERSAGGTPVPARRVR